MFKYALLLLLIKAATAIAAPTGELIAIPAAQAPHAAPDDLLIIGRAARLPKIDGQLDPAEWASAGFTRFAGDANATFVQALYDDANLYFAFTCHEPQMDKLLARFGPGRTGKFAPNAKGDSEAYTDDSIEVFIAPQRAQTRIFQFIANTIGGQLDLVNVPPRTDATYQSGFTSAAQVLGDRWTLEMSIPLKAIDVTTVVPGETAVRINFGRNRMTAGAENIPWQDFWAFKGDMPPAVFAAASDIALGDVHLGPRHLGQNTAIVTVRSSTAGRKLHLETLVDGSSAAGADVNVEPGQTAQLPAPYHINSTTAPFSLALKIAGTASPLAITSPDLQAAAPMQAMIERQSVGPADGAAGTLLNLNLSPASLPDYSLRATLLQGETVAATVAGPITSLRQEVRWTPDAAGSETYTVKLELLDKAGKSVAATNAGTFTWSAAPKAPALAGSLPLLLNVYQKDATGPWPVTLGIPFAKGALDSADHVRLLSPTGIEIPIEVGIPATWDRQRTSIQWLHIRAPVNLADAGKTYTLEFGPKIQRAPAKSKLAAAQTDQEITIDTGKLKLVCGRKPFRLIDRAWLDVNGDGTYSADEQVITPGQSSGLLVQTADGRAFRSDVDVDFPDLERVELESAGTHEAVIRAEGWHKSVSPNASGRMMKYVVRLVLYNDSALLRLFHSFIVTEDDRTQYRQVTVGFSLPEADTTVSNTYSSEPRLDPAAIPPASEICLTQVDHNAFRTALRTPEHAHSLKALQCGSYSEGWLLVQRPTWGLTLATRDFWQNYAKGYEIRRDSVTLCPWPKDSLAPLSFRPEDVIAPIFVQKLVYSTAGSRIEDGGNYGTYTYDAGTTCLGTSKTHEYLLEFDPKPTPQRAKLVQALLNDPPLLVVPPTHVVATQALARISACDNTKYPVEEKAYRAMLKRQEWGKPEDRHFGLINFGESYQLSDPTGLIYVYRTYQNAGYGIINDFMKGYLRSGERDWFRYAIRRARHARDIDHCYYGPNIGGQSAYDTLNWGPLYALMTFWNHRQFLLLDWYVTGDRRSLDTFQIACDQTARLPAPTGPLDERAYFNPVKELIIMYQATWNPRFLELAKAHIEGILLAREKMPTGEWPPEAIQKTEYIQPALIVYHQFTQDPRVLEYLKAYFRDHKGTQTYATGLSQDAAAYLYWVTGDVQWLLDVGGYETMRDYMRLWETSQPPPRGGMRKWSVPEAEKNLAHIKIRPKQVFADSFMDKNFHHTWERLWYFSAALDDAKQRGLLTPYEGPINAWTGPIWEDAYWKSVTPEKAKEYGWQP